MVVFSGNPPKYSLQKNNVTKKIDLHNHIPGAVTIIKIIKEFIVKKIENSARCWQILQFHFQLDSKCPCGIQYARHRIEIESQIFYRAPPPTSDCMHC